MIAALFVETNGVYFGLPDVDPWDEKRDARKYDGPYPVVAHPPCQRWGRYWYGGPSVTLRKTKGDDGGCFASALASVRKWGGVLEHPQASAAWKRFDLNEPPWGGAWVCADFFGGFTCCVEQGHYGHRARKATWLYACDVRSLPSLKWGASAQTCRIDDDFHSAEERRRFRRLRAGSTQARVSRPPRRHRPSGPSWLNCKRLIRAVGFSPSARPGRMPGPWRFPAPFGALRRAQRGAPRLRSRLDNHNDCCKPPRRKSARGSSGK
jgi:hypothetical protein